jgi:hypothetical protein
MTAARLRSAFWTSPLVHGSHCLPTSRPIWPLFLGTPCRPASSDVLVRAAGGSRHGVVDRLRVSRKSHAGSRDCAGARLARPESHSHGKPQQDTCVEASLLDES